MTATHEAFNGQPEANSVLESAERIFYPQELTAFFNIAPLINQCGIRVSVLETTTPISSTDNSLAIGRPRSYLVQTPSLALLERILNEVRYVPVFFGSDSRLPFKARARITLDNENVAREAIMRVKTEYDESQKPVQQTFGL